MNKEVLKCLTKAAKEIMSATKHGKKKVIDLDVCLEEVRKLYVRLTEVAPTSENRVHTKQEEYVAPQFRKGAPDQSEIMDNLLNAGRGR